MRRWRGVPASGDTEARVSMPRRLQLRCEFRRVCRKRCSLAIKLEADPTRKWAGEDGSENEQHRDVEGAELERGQVLALGPRSDRERGTSGTPPAVRRGRTSNEERREVGEQETSGERQRRMSGFLASCLTVARYRQRPRAKEKK